MEIVIGLVGGVFLGFLAGRSGRDAVRSAERQRAREEFERDVQTVAASVEQGRLPKEDGAAAPLAAIVRAVERAWAPRDVERKAALSAAVGRVSRFLDRQVRGPLTGAAPNADAGELRERIERALGALEDVDFFLRDTLEDRQGTDLVALVQRVSREFAADHEATVRLQFGAPSIRATVSPEQLLDALYLILHNAARFGGGGTVDLAVVQDGGRSVVRIRDRGPGFSEEAFVKAFDPFYSETEDGLGLGLPHARKTVEAMGGAITLRNVPDGGAEVEVSLPS